MIGQLLCAIGWHRWEYRTAREHGLEIIYARCARACERYDAEMLVEVERRASLCSCARHACDPRCVIHGRIADNERSPN